MTDIPTTMAALSLFPPTARAGTSIHGLGSPHPPRASASAGITYILQEKWKGVEGETQHPLSAA